MVQYYFRQVRPHLIHLSIDAGHLEQLDRISQHLLKLASKRSQRSTYRTRMRELDNLRGEIETAIEIRATGGSAHPAGRLTTATEAAILATLDPIVPSTARSRRLRIFPSTSSTSR